MSSENYLFLPSDICSLEFGHTKVTYILGQDEQIEGYKIKMFFNLVLKSVNFCLLKQNKNII